MNILYYFLETNSYMHNWQRIHIFDELERAGHTFVVFNPFLFHSFEEANEQLLKYIKSAKKSPDLFMTCVNSKQISNSTIQEIKKYGIPTLLICFDNLHAPYMHKRIAKDFDLIWLTSNETQYLFNQWGCNTIYQPYAANPYMFKPNFTKEILGVGFIGTPYGTRTLKINLLTDNKIKVNVFFGTGQPKVSTNNSENNSTDLFHSFFNLIRFPIGRKVIHGAALAKLQKSKYNKLNDNEYLGHFPSVSFEDMNKMYSNFSLSLGITELRNTFTLAKPIHKIHLRTFEIPMSGGLQISSYTEELASYFEDNKEIILYKSNDEFIDKAKFYSTPSRSSLRKQMKLAARKRAENDHIWNKRFNTVFNEILS